MKIQRTPSPSSPDTPHEYLSTQVLIGLLILGAVLVYANSFSGAFVFDDDASIVKNATIRHLPSIRSVLMPPSGETVGGRPLLNLSLALNYAISGTAVWSYHLVNLIVHVLAGLTLFGILRRTLAQYRPGLSANEFAATIALIWLVHPLQTEAVTYVVQRAESLAGLCYLLTIYCVIRAAENPVASKWKVLAVTACALGMATKEVMVSAPLIALLYDRTFIAGSFREAWHRRREMYVGLFGCWLLLAALMTMNGRGSSAGMATGISSWSYALTQSQAIVTYLKLSAWPNPLIFDYGTVVASGLGEVALSLALVIVLLGLTIYALMRKPVLGFAGAMFFAVLAPSSSVIPIAAQTIAEHRMYLPLSVLIALVLLGLETLLHRKALLAGALWAICLGAATVSRNRDYQTERALLADTIQKWPGNSRAHYSLGRVYASMGQPDEAVRHYREAVALSPDFFRAQNDLGVALAGGGQVEEAEVHFRQALLAKPDFVEALFNDGSIQLQLGHAQEGADAFRRAIAIQPEFVGGHAALGDALIRLGRFPEAEEQFATAVRLKPDSLDLHINWARLLDLLRRPQEAVVQYEAAIALNPGIAPIHNELGKTLARLNSMERAIGEFQAALRIDPGFAEATENLARARKLLRGPG